MTKIVTNCKYCKEEFYAERKFINRGNAKFCSRSCGAKYNGWLKTRPNTVCAYCDTAFYKKNSKKTSKHSKSGLFFCCNDHKNKASESECGVLKLNHYSEGTSSYRKIAFNNYKHECNRCAFVGEYTSTLVVHHKDRDRANNDVSNLEILCRNCHYEEHYGEARKAKSVISKNKTKTKIEWPELDDLTTMVRNSSYTAVGKELGVSNTAVKKYIWRRMPDFKKKP